MEEREMEDRKQNDSLRSEPEFRLNEGIPEEGFPGECESPAGLPAPGPMGNILHFPRTGQVASAQEGVSGLVGECEGAKIIPMFFREESARKRVTAPRNTMIAESENMLLKRRLEQRRDWLKRQVLTDPDQLKGLREIEILDSLLEIQGDNVLMVESLQYKKNLIYAQYNLPVEYMQVDNLTRQLMAFNKTLAVLSLDTPISRLDPNIESLKAMKAELHRELEEMDLALQSQFNVPKTMESSLLNHLKIILSRVFKFA